MKKNKMMRIASVLLVAVLLSTCVISGTFAKYVTKASGSDSARVAKFGVEVAVVVDGAFAAEYNADVVANDKNGAAIAKTVISTNGTDKVLAPGTAGWLLESATITGTPEVAVNVKYEADLTLTGWEVDGVYYCPLSIVIGENTYYGLDYASATAFEAAVEAALNSDINYAPKTNLAAEHDVAWRWAFEGTDGKQTDVKDTALGDAATAATIEFEITITVTQIGGSEALGKTEEASSTVAP
ncbi:MAG: hypothetical protein IJX19_03210 [Clostridia bacterium]|nr:hypothetical protein [Clostridia bacterium]